MSRTSSRTRTTQETDITVSIDLDGSGVTAISTGLPFFDHMLDQLGRHGGFDLTISAVGDLQVDGHHTIEDTGILLGECFRAAVGDKAGVRRFASGLYPLDEALIEVALDLKFGETGLRLLPEIQAIADDTKLEAVLHGIRTATSPEDLRRVWTD